MNGFTIPSIRTAMIWLLIIMIASFAIGGVIVLFDHSDPQKIERSMSDVNVRSDGIEKARVNLVIDSGSVNLSGYDGPDLLFGTVHIDGKNRLPHLSHTLTNGTGNVVIERSPDIMHEIIGGDENWTLSLHNQIQTSLLVSLGTGDVKVVSGGTNVSELAIESGAGSIFLDLHEWKGKTLPVKIDNGVGEITALFPEKSEVSVSLDKAIGNSVISGFTANEQGYFHQSTDPDAPVITVTISQGLGDLTLKTIP